MRGEKYFKWKKLKKPSDRFDDGSIIRISKVKGGKYCTLEIRKSLIKSLKEGDRISLFYSDKGYLGIKKELVEKYYSYPLRNRNKYYYNIRGGILNKFSPIKYFKEDVQIEDGMIIIKVNLIEGKKIIWEDLIQEETND